MRAKRNKTFPMNRPKDPAWVRSPKGRFYRFIHLDPEDLQLQGVGGVYVVWCAGTRPRWICVGAADDLARAFHTLGGETDIMDLDSRGGLFVTWALIRPEYRAGVVAHLADLLRPEVAPTAVPEGTAPIPVLPPGVAPPPARQQWFDAGDDTKNGPPKDQDKKGASKISGLLTRLLARPAR